MSERKSSLWMFAVGVGFFSIITVVFDLLVLYSYLFAEKEKTTSQFLLMAIFLIPFNVASLRSIWDFKLRY